MNALSREISAGLVGIDEAFARLREIEQIPPTKGYFQILAAGMGSGCFGFLLGAGRDGQPGGLPHRLSPVRVGP